MNKKPIILCIEPNRTLLHQLYYQLKLKFGDDYAIKTVHELDNLLFFIQLLLAEGFVIQLLIVNHHLSEVLSLTRQQLPDTPCLELGETADHQQGLPVPWTRAQLYSKVLNLIQIKPEIKKSTILLVEDEAINRLVTQKLLLSLGMAVDAVNHGAEALAQLAQKPYDAVILDWHMPIMNGYQTAKKIRENKALSNLPIVIMSACLKTDIEAKCADIGIKGFIEKPLIFEQVKAVLQPWLSLTTSTTQTDWHDKTTLQDFYQQYQYTGLEIEQALKQNHRAQAIHLSHKLRGVAAQLDIKTLAQAAQQLETLLLAGASDYQPALTLLVARLVTVLSAIERN